MTRRFAILRRSLGELDVAQPTLLIFRLGSIGDTVVALPCFHAIAREFSRHRRVLLSNPASTARAAPVETLLGGAGFIDEVMYYQAGLRHSPALLQTLRRRRFDTLIYLADRPRTLAVCRDLLFFKAAGIPRIVGAHVARERRDARPDPVTGELEPEPARLARTLHAEIAVDLSPANWDLRLTAAERAAGERWLPPTHGPILAVAAGAKVPRKDWGEENWRALFETLWARRPDTSLVFIGAGDERPLAERLRKVWAGRAVNVCGETAARESAALLARCDLLVCHDSGPMHLAASQGTRCVALFGNYNIPRRWFPFGPGHRVVYEPKGVRCITVARVVEELAAALPDSRRIHVA